MASLNLGSAPEFNRIVNYGNIDYVKNKLSYDESGYIEAMIRTYRITEDPVFIQNALLHIDYVISMRLVSRSIRLFGTYTLQSRMISEKC